MTDFNKSLQIKFHENLSNWSQVISSQTDGLTDNEANCFFCSFANAPEEIMLLFLFILRNL